LQEQFSEFWDYYGEPKTTGRTVVLFHITEQTDLALTTMLEAPHQHGNRIDKVFQPIPAGFS